MVRERPTLTSRKRRRLALSCEECRRRKNRCDRDQPCAPCVRLRSECLYKDHRRSTTPPDPAQLPGIWNVSRNGRPLLPLPPRPRLEPPQPSAFTPVPLHNLDGFKQSSDNPPGSGTLVKETRIIPSRELTEPRTISHEPATFSVPAPNTAISEAGFQRLHTTISKTRASRWSQWVADSPEFTHIVAFFRAMVQEAVEDAGVSNNRPLLEQARAGLRRCKSIAKSLEAARPARRSFTLPPPFSLPLRRATETAVKLYFRYFESTHRILHVPSFWEHYDKFWEDPQAAPLGVRFQVLLVAAIGSSLDGNSPTDSELGQATNEWVFTAQMWLSGPLEKDRLNVTGIQVHCLVILARQILNIGAELIWPSLGSLLHRAMYIGLHRDPRYLPPMSLLQAEVRRRLWATILEFLVQASLDSEMPQRISVDEYDTHPPMNINDDEIHESTAIPNSRHETETTATSLQLLLLKSLPLRLRILKVLNGLSFDITYADALALASDLENMCGECQDILISANGIPLNEFHRNMFDFLVRRFLLYLHSPFSSRASAEPMFAHSRRVSLETALIISSPEPDTVYSSLRATSGAIFRNGIQQAGMSILLELLAVTLHQRANGTLHRASQQREILKRTIRDMIDVSAQRIRRGESNVKPHIFPGMVLAEVKAMESGEDVHTAIARSAVSSLDFCIATLSERARLRTTSLSHALADQHPSLGTEPDFDHLTYSFDLFGDGDFPDWE